MPADRPPTPRSTAQGSSIPRTILVLLAALALAACSAVGSPVPGITASPTTSPSATAAVTGPPPCAQPLHDDEGTAVAVPATPHRIVSLSPATTEILWALGAGDRQVGRTDADDFPAEAAAVAAVASYTGVDVERIVDLDADLVLAAGNGFTPPEAIQRLRSLGIPVVVVYAPGVADVLADIELIGCAVGAWPAAHAVASAMAEGRDAIAAAAAASGTRPRTFYELDATGAIYGPADDSFVADMVSLAGGEPITTGSPTVFQISLERLVAADPEIIILGDANYGVTPEIVAARPGWGDMTAVRAGAVYPVDDVVVTRPGPRLIDGLLILARAIHPDVDFEPSASP